MPTASSSRLATTALYSAVNNLTDHPHAATPHASQRQAQPVTDAIASRSHRLVCTGRLLVMLMSLSAVGCATMPSPQVADRLFTPLEDIVRSAGAGSGEGSKVDAIGKPSRTAVGLQALPPNHAKLFAKGTVTGEDLYEHLREMKQTLARTRNAEAAAKLSLALDQVGHAANPGAALDSGFLQETAIKFFLSRLQAEMTTVAFSALDDYLKYLLEDHRVALAKQTVTLPDAKGLTPAQAKLAVNER
jgi:hypothetical protein